VSLAAPSAARGGALSPHQRAGLLLAWLLAMLLGGGVIARSQFSADLSAFLPASPDTRQRLLIEQLQSGVAARTLILGITGGDAPARAEASRRLGAALRKGGDFDQVNNGERVGWEADSQGQGGAGEWLVQHRYHLSPAVTPERFSVAGLRDAVDETLSLLGTPAGALVKPLLARDPTGETQRIVEALIPSGGPRSVDGIWVSRTEPRAVLLLQTRASGADLDSQAAMLQRVHQAFDQATARTPALTGLSLAISGPPVFAVASRTSIETEVKQLAIAGTLLMGTLLLLAFGSVPALLVAFLPVATGVVAGIVAVSLGFGTVHGITLGFGSTLIGEAVDYAIYYLIQARGEAGPTGTGFRQWQRASWPTVRLGLLTSVCGFAALVFSGFPGLAQLGVFSLAGLLAAALAARWVLPALMPDGAAGTGLRRPLGAATAWATARLPRLRGLFWALGAAALALLLWQRSALWTGDLASLSPVPRAAMALDAQLRADLSADDERTLVVVPGADLQATLRAAEAVGALLDPLIERGQLASYDSPTRFLPSQATQRARLASLPEPALLQARLGEALAGGPLPASRLGGFVAEVEAARRLPLIDRAALAGSPLSAAVDAMLLQRTPANGGGWLALLSLHPATGQQALGTEGLRGVLAGVPGAQVIDIKVELDSLYRRYLHEALWQSALGALAVVALLALALRSWRRLLAVCQPLALAVLITLAGLAAAGVNLGILHLVGLLLVVAVGSNYVLFFDQFTLQRSGALPGGASHDTLASLLLANLTTVGSFALIALSQIPALSAIGQVVAPGALLSLLLSAAFVGGRPDTAPAAGRV